MHPVCAREFLHTSNPSEISAFNRFCTVVFKERNQANKNTMPKLFPEEPTDGFQGQILYAPVQSGKKSVPFLRKIIVWIVFINEQTGDPEQCNGIDNDAQWQIQYSQKGKVQP